MLQFSKLSSLARYTLSFVLYFAHGGLVMAGVLVIGFIGYQVTHYGAEGLNPRALLGMPLASASASMQEGASTDVVEVAATEDVEPAVAVNKTEATGLTPALNRVARAIAKRHKVSPLVVEDLVKAAQKEGRANGIDPLLILAVVTVESRFNPYAESVFGAQGLMQIIPKFHQDKISAEKGQTALFDPAENIRVGTKILKDYMKLTGSIDGALQAYGGATDDPALGYSTKVKGELERLKVIAGGGTTPRTTTARANGEEQGPSLL